MTPATLGAFAIIALPAAAAEALAIAGWCTGPFTVLLIIILAIRHRRHLRGLMDDGDGQGGVPPIARKLAQAEAETQAVSMRGMVAVPALQGITACPEFCDDLTSPGDPDACTCADPCSRAWCTRRRERNPVPVEWEREGGWR